MNYLLWSYHILTQYVDYYMWPNLIQFGVFSSSYVHKINTTLKKKRSVNKFVMFW